MTERERMMAVLSFNRPDRIPLDPGHGRKSTRERWIREGLPEAVTDIPEFAYRQAGGTLPWPKGGPGFRVDERMMPHFEEKVVERKAESQVVQDWKGNLCEIGNEFTVEYLRHAIDFVTRRWIKCPVESRADWTEMKRRYAPDAPGRLPEDAATLGKELAGREHFVEIHLSGPYWQLREWCGFEGLSMMFYDDPKLVREMLEFWRDYVLRLLERAFAHCVPDAVHISEDMAFKGFAMLSPTMVREFLLPVWIAWGEAIRRAGVPVYAIDSDGFVGELIPLWIEAGMSVCDPMEVAAGNDLAALRRQFGRAMAFRGGIDKRAIAKGGRWIEAEMARLQPVIDDGGYLPGCDHGVPSDVSWPDYVRYTGLLAKATGW
jgi:uroporphyrinogen decarboxylase